MLRLNGVRYIQRCGMALCIASIKRDLSCAQIPQGFWVILRIFSVSPLPARWLGCLSVTRGLQPPLPNLWPTYSGQEHPVSAGSDADTLPRSGIRVGPVNWSPPIADSSLFRAFKRLSTPSWSGTAVAVEEWGAEPDLGYQLDSFSACKRC